MALEKEEEAARPAAAPPDAAGEAGDEVVTTDEERQGFFIVQAILAELVSLDRVTMRDQKSYCSVLLDDNNRKPICRLRFNAGQKYLGLFDAEKNETRVPLARLEEIFQHGEALREVVRRYLGPAEG